MFSNAYKEDLREQKAKAHAAMEAIAERAKSAGDLSAEDRAAFDKAEDDYKQAVRDLQRAEEMDARADRGDVPEFLQPASGRSGLGRFWEEPGFTVPLAEMAASRRVNRDGSVEYRDVTTSAATGAFTGYARELYERLIDSSAVLRAGFKTINTDRGQSFVLPGFSVYGTAAITAEGSAIAEDDPTSSSVTFNSFKYGIVLQASNEFLADAPASAIEDYLGDALVTALDNAINPHLATGTGTVQPLGVFNFTAAATVTSGTAAGSNRIDSDAIVEAYYTLAAPYRRNGVWIMEDTTLQYLSQQTDSQGRPFILPQGAAGNPVDLLMGRPVYSDSYSPAVGSAVDAVWFGDPMRAGALRIVNPGVQLARSSEFAFANDLTSWRGTCRLDFQEVDTQASVFVAGAIT